MNLYILNLLVIGLLLLLISIGSTWISGLPLSYAIIYLLCGIFLGPHGIGLFELRPDAEFLERLAEFVVIVSVFSCGLKMNRPFQLWAWKTTVRLIGFLMPISIVAIAIIAHSILKFDWGVAVLLGAILAPTDPVLASEVQLSNVEDRDELRFGLTSEGGLNDALAFPFVYFGIYWIKDSNWENWFRQWVLIDLLWAIAAGIVIGVVVAQLIVLIDLRLRTEQSEEKLRENLIAFSIILLAYVLAEIVNGYGFIAVFVAGITVQKSYKNYDKEERYLEQLEFTEQIEKILEIATILLLGSILLLEPIIKYSGQGLLIALLLLFIIRPVGVWISFIGSSTKLPKRFLFGWFGIRGVGSLYYLTYALGKGLEKNTIEQISWITLITIVLSVILHGVSATPLMNWYEQNVHKSTKLKPDEN